MQAHFLVLLSVHTAGNDDGDVLLGHGGIGEHAGALGEEHETRGALRQLLEAVDDDLELVGILHNAAEHHGDDRHGDGEHHAHNTAALKEAGHGVAGLGREGGFEHGERFVAEVVAVHAVVKQGAHVALGLEDHAEDRAGDDAEGDAGDGGHLHGDRHDDDDRRQEQERVDGEHGLQRAGELRHAAHIGVAAVILHGAENAEGNEGDAVGDAGGQDHALNVGHNVRACHSGGEVRGIGQRGHLVAEVGTGEDRAGGHAGVHAETEANAHEGDAHRTHRAPGGTGGQRGDGANENSRNEEDCGLENFQTVVDHRGDDAGIDPDADEDTDDDEDADRLEGLINAVHHCLFNGFPLVAEVERHHGSAEGADEHGNVRVNAVFDDTERQHGDQERHRQQGFPQLGHTRGLHFLFFTHLIVPTFL